MNDNNRLISTLVENVSPVKIKKPIRTTVISFFVSLVGTLIVFGIFFSKRADLQGAMSNSTFLFSGFAALVLCLLGFFAAIFFSTPGRVESRYLLSILGIFTGGLILSLLLWPNTDKAEGMVAAQHCSMSVMALGLLSLCVFGYVTRRLAPEHPGLIGALCGVASACLGMAALSFSCPSENSYHLLIWHLSLPFIGFGLIGFFFGRKLLRW